MWRTSTNIQYSDLIKHTQLVFDAFVLASGLQWLQDYHLKVDVILLCKHARLDLTFSPSLLHSPVLSIFVSPGAYERREGGLCAPGVTEAPLHSSCCDR